MSFRSCWRLTGAVQRLLWVSKFTAPPGTSNPVGQNPACSVISINRGWKRKFYSHVPFQNGIARYCGFRGLMTYTCIVFCMFCF